MKLMAEGMPLSEMPPRGVIAHQIFVNLIDLKKTIVLDITSEQRYTGKDLMSNIIKTCNSQGISLPKEAVNLTINGRTINYDKSLMIKPGETVLLQNGQRLCGGAQNDYIGQVKNSLE